MALNVNGCFQNKSVKLSDAFTVEIDGVEMVGCCGFTLPTLEYNEETVKYGNTSQTVLIPKYDNLQVITLDIYEDSEGSIRSKFFKDKTNGFRIGKTVSISQAYSSTGYTSNSVTYSAKNRHDIGELKITVLSNKLTTNVLTYSFKNLTIVNYKQYTLDHSAEDICKWSISFAFESYAKTYHIFES